MKIFLEPPDRAARRDVVEVLETHAVFSGECPACRASPFRVSGRDRRVVDDREYRSDGSCLDCGASAGTIVAQPQTLFGIAEDERVLYGRCRVYGHS